MSNMLADNFGNRLGTEKISADTLTQGTAKAWHNLNGTGTIAMRDSFNVSSTVDEGAGTYTFNWSTAFPSANYAAAGAATNPAGLNGHLIGPVASSANQTVSSFRAQAWNRTDGSLDAGFFFGTYDGDPA